MRSTDRYTYLLCC